MRCSATSNEKLKARNEALDAEVRDLKSGYEAIEERARSELGMVKQDEVFFQLQPRTASEPPTVPAPGLPSSAAVARVLAVAESGRCRSSFSRLGSPDDPARDIAPESAAA